MIDSAIIGAAGYTGAELTRLLSTHPAMSLKMVTSTADAGRRVADLYPALAHVGLSYVEPDLDAVAAVASVAFLAVPHTAAMAVAPSLLDAGLTVIDLSADFRLKDAAVWERWYETAHTAPELIAGAVYGLPELGRGRLAGAKLVACPGCYPTASLLAAAPALAAGIGVGCTIVVDAKSGVSGAGRGLSSATHYCSVNESLAPYKVASHRHTPEIAQGMSLAAGCEVKVAFTPHLVPMTRGLLATVYLPAEGLSSAEEARALYSDAYAEEPFVTVHPVGRMPGTREVTGSNRAHLGVALDEASGTLVVACAIDNLVKGAAGQAVQCANVALGLDETAGLTGVGPAV